MMMRAAGVAVSALYGVMLGCQPAQAPVPLISMEEGHTFALVQSPPGARLHFTVEHEAWIAGDAYMQVQVTLKEGDEIREAGHLFVRQTEDGLYWRLTDSAHTLLQPGFFQHPTATGATYAFGDARYRVGREPRVVDGVSRDDGIGLGG